jgi:hypothetical protein
VTDSEGLRQRDVVTVTPETKLWVDVPYGRFHRVLLIKESEGIERRLLDYKFYAWGVGLVLGVEVSGGSDRAELVRFTRAG